MTDDPGAGTDPAKSRWLALQALRWTGVGIFVFGLLIYAGKINLPEIAAYPLMAIGLFDALFAPSYFARRWKTPL